MPFVRGFLPSTNAPLFSNGRPSWPPGTSFTISVLGLPVVTVDATKNGLVRRDVVSYARHLSSGDATAANP
jgi:hypothetical protein